MDTKSYMLFLGIVTVLEALAAQTNLSNSQKTALNNIIIKIRGHLDEVDSEK